MPGTTSGLRKLREPQSDALRLPIKIAETTVAARLLGGGAFRSVKIRSVKEQLSRAKVEKAEVTFAETIV